VIILAVELTDSYVDRFRQIELRDGIEAATADLQTWIK